MDADVEREGRGEAAMMVLMEEVSEGLRARARARA